MIIGMCIDGVMTLSEEYFKKKGSKFYYYGKPIVDQNKYDAHTLFIVSEKKSNQFWVYNIRDYFANCKIRDGLFDFSKSLYLLGHKIVVITNRLNSLDGLTEEETKSYTESFLKKNLYKYENIYYSFNNKAEIAKQLNLDFMIEDSPKFIKEISSICPVIYPVTSYNQHLLNSQENIYAIHNFSSALNIIDALS